MCNRLCDWCPNKNIDRTMFKTLDEQIYLEVLHELGNNNFTGTITYSRYNEPMVDLDLLRLRTAQAKELLPYVKLVTNTNGDYLSPGCLDNLQIDELSIMDYDCCGSAYCVDKLKLIGADIIGISDKYIFAEYNNMLITYFINWPMNTELIDRGGILEIEDNIRTTCCREPHRFIGIDYTGDVVPCCNIRGDHPKHKGYILGNLHDNILTHIFTGKDAEYFRRATIDIESHILPEPCRYCHKEAGRYTRDNPGLI